MRSPLLLPCVLLALSISPARAALVVDFDAGSTDLTDNFAGVGQSLPTWVSSGGVNNTGSLIVTAGNSTDVGQSFANFQGVAQSGAESFDLIGSSLTTSMFFLFNNPPPNNPAAARLLDLYITSATDATVTGATAHVGIRLDTISNNTTFRYQLRNNNVSSAPSGNFSLSTGVWYQMAVTFTNPDDTNINLSVELYDRGATGTASPTLVGGNASYSVNTTNAVLTADSAVYGAFRIPRGDNVDQLDNFSFVNAVPEPGSAALVALGLAAVALRRRSLR